MNPFNWFLMVVCTKEFGKRFAVVAVVLFPIQLALLKFVNDPKLLMLGQVLISVSAIVAVAVCYIKANKELKDDDDE